jgi:hypothetical protein
MNRTSDSLRVIARAMPMSFPPLEAAGLAVLMLVWLLAA